MNENETELRVQALVDGEITGREAEDLRARIETDDGHQVDSPHVLCFDQQTFDKHPTTRRKLTGRVHLI